MANTIFSGDNLYKEWAYQQNNYGLDSSREAFNAAGQQRDPVSHNWWDVLWGRSAAQVEKLQNQQFELGLANTAHQREVADLKAAGLNPWLSASGGAGAPVVSAQENVSMEHSNKMTQAAMTALSMIALALVRKVPNTNNSFIKSLVRHVR